MSVRVKDNTDEFLSEYEEALERALTRIGLQGVSYAKTELSKPKPHADGSVRPNVDTGFLRNSLTFAIDGQGAEEKSYTDDRGSQKGEYSGTAPKTSDPAVFIGTNVEYGISVELGRHGGMAYPYLKPAATEHSAVYKRIFEDEMGGDGIG